MRDQIPPAASGMGREMQQKGPEVRPPETRMHSGGQTGCACMTQQPLG